MDITPGTKHRRFDTSTQKCFNGCDLDLLSDLRFVTVCGASFIAALSDEANFIHLDLSTLVIRPLSKSKRLKAQKPLKLPMPRRSVERIQFFGTEMWTMRRRRRRLWCSRGCFGLFFGNDSRQTGTGDYEMCALSWMIKRWQKNKNSFSHPSRFYLGTLFSLLIMY